MTLTALDMLLYDCGKKSGTSGATQSSAVGLYCFDAGVNAGAVGAKKNRQKQHSLILTDILPGVVPLGLNGAAIAAFGDNPVDLGDAI